MSFSEPSDCRDRFFNAARDGRLQEVKELSNEFNNDMMVLSQAVIGSCWRGHIDIVKWLVKNTAVDVNYINSEDRLKYLPLTAACDYDQLHVVKYLVEACHANVNLPDKRGHTSLTQACRYFSMSVSMYLCEVRDLDVNIADNDGNIGLHYAIWCNKDNFSKLHEICDKGDVIELLRLVYVRDHKINVRDNFGFTPLHWACFKGHSDIVRTLMLAGADETITNDERMTPAQVAVNEGHTGLLKLLDSNNLWQMILGGLNNSKMSVVILLPLTLRLIRKRQMTRRWCHTLTITHVLLTIGNIIKSGRTNVKLKRNEHFIIHTRLM